ncbi:DUF551 domain-containing protein [Escherichia coli]|uniref:DUF551 domain-containing protein n=1 Tax=Escherichia coli TaxID=562 RepID=UPI0021E7CCA5|nr:DUF551 domain-containing protein [Escherichia coli]EIC4997424.1 DUF551 domain-containing protein [Escherichia coli]MCV3047281.1 DUF551 domain-containing protein [Escherichia coli]MCV3062366.1 DUF551 domain-containing protein [Escherichia coli]
MTTFTKEQLIEMIKRNITVMDRYPDLVTAQMDLEVYKIALASLEAEAPSLPGGFTIKETQELYEDLVRSHISQALSGEKMKKKDREADLRWIHDVIVQAAWFVKASLEKNSLSGTPPVTPDGWISCSERMPAQDDWILIYSKHGEYMAGQVQGEYVELSDGTLSWLGNALYWMPLPEPPQEVSQ